MHAPVIHELSGPARNANQRRRCPRWFRCGAAASARGSRRRSRAPRSVRRRCRSAPGWAHGVGADARRSELVGDLLDQHLQTGLGHRVRRHVAVRRDRGDRRHRDDRPPPFAARCGPRASSSRNAPVRLVSEHRIPVLERRRVERPRRPGARVGDDDPQRSHLVGRRARGHDTLLVGDVARHGRHRRPVEVRSATGPPMWRADPRCEPRGPRLHRRQRALGRKPDRSRIRRR